MKFLVACLVLTGCQKLHYRPTYSIGAEFVPYVQRFSEAYSVPVRVSVRFADSTRDWESYTVAQCTADLSMPNTGNEVVRVRRSYWEKASDTEREILLWHELGHCVFGQMHRDEGIMTPFLPPEGYYRSHQQWYRQELVRPGLPLF